MVAALWVVAGGAVLAQEIPKLLEQAAKAYDAGRCGEVISLYETISAAREEAIDGIAEYRWGYCEAYLNRADGGPRYQRAAEKLGRQTQDEGAPLESHFYLVNALLNLGRREDARKAAALATARYEQGQLVIPSSRPESWFRLGKLYQDAGDPQGAIEPFTRALDEADKGGTLRDAYIERIARGAGAAGANQLALRAGSLLEKQGQAGAGALSRIGRARLDGGDLQGARKAFEQAARMRGEAALAAKYALEVVHRTEELSSWGLSPSTTTRDGRPLASLGQEELTREIAAASRMAWKALSGRAVEVPRKKRAGTRPAPHPKTLRTMHEAQAYFTGLMLEAVKRGAPLREWNVKLGIGPLLFHPWTKLFVQQANKTRAGQVTQDLD